MAAMDLEDLRLAVYQGFVDEGRPPSVEDLSRQLSATSAEVHDGLAELARQRHVVLDAEGAVVMAHPFSAVPLGFSVMGRRTLWWGGCAWDSFALPHLLDSDPSVLVATTCPGCGRAHAFVVDRSGPPEGGQVAHFLVPTKRMWDDVVHTCGHQRVFCDEGCVDSWLAATGNQRGYVMDLAMLWRFASRWYDGRLARGYTRRDPASADGYFREVGLTGAFWFDH
jgi:hypothetical protein